MEKQPVSICLPKGSVLEPLAALLNSVDFPISGYTADNRSYRPRIDQMPARAKIMAEKDVAIQVAVGNYDMGCCGLDWITEHAVRYRTTRLHVFKKLGVGKKKIYACSGLGGDIADLTHLAEKSGYLTLVSEYPNLAEDFAIRHKLRKFKVFSAWGSVEAYPPEHADVVILAAKDEASLLEMGLRPLSLELPSQLCLVINKANFVQKDLTGPLAYFSEMEIPS
jgi:ATP phosphoribosyltransferase